MWRRAGSRLLAAASRQRAPPPPFSLDVALSRGRRRAFDSPVASSSRRASSGSSGSSSSSSSSRGFASSAAPSPSPTASPPVTRRQLREVFLFSAVPFVAFGFVDNTVLIHAGDAIDSTFGVALGLSSLAAAALGQIFSDTSGVLFGSTIEGFVLRCGLAAPSLTPTQQLARGVRVASTLGKVFGVVLGCSLGLVNLLVVDARATEKAKEEKEYDAIFKAIMDKGHEIAACDAATLWIVDETSGEMWSRASVGNAAENVVVRRPLDVGIVGAVARGGLLSNVADAYADPDFDASIDRDGITGFTSRTILTCPVKSARGDVVAVVQMVNKSPPDSASEKKMSEKKRFGRFGRRHARGPVPFDETDEKLVRMMCEHVAVSMAAMEHTLT